MAQSTAEADGPAIRLHGARIGLFYAALCLVYGVHLPYLPVWLDWRGLSPGEIALVTSLPFFFRVGVTPAVAIIADRAGAHRRTIVVMAWSACVLALALSAAAGFWPILACAVLYAIATATLMPLIETIAVSGVRAAGLHYGRMRLWGSLSFLAIAFAGGAAIDAVGPGAAIWLLAGATLATAGAAHLLPLPMAYRAEDARAPAGPFAADAKRLLRAPVFLVFLAAVGAAQGSHAFFYTFGVLHWRAEGLSSTWTGTLWAIGIFAEIALFAMPAAGLRKFGAAALLMAGAGAAAMRWTAMAFDPSLAVLIVLQLTHALTYGATHLAAIRFIVRAAPSGAAATAQALYSLASGVALGLATLAGGWLYARFGGGGYAVMALLALAGLAASAALARMWREEGAP